MPTPERRDLSPTVPFRQQVQQAGPGPVVFINTFTIDPSQAEAMLATWAKDSLVMKRQPGFISAQLHEGIADSGVFVNVAVWESAEHLKDAMANPEFQAAIAETPSGTITRPHLFRKVAVPGVCVA